MLVCADSLFSFSSSSHGCILVSISVLTVYVGSAIKNRLVIYATMIYKYNVSLYMEYVWEDAISATSATRPILIAH